MDVPGWKAARKAAHDDQLFGNPQRSADGHFIAVERVEPINEAFDKFAPLEYDTAPPITTSHEIETLTDSSLTLHEGVKTSTALQRSHDQRRQAPLRMNPHLQVMCGPLLRYDTVDSQGNYRAGCLIVTADAGSVYDPHPHLSLEWDPDSPYFTKKENHRDSSVLGDAPENMSESNGDVSLDQSPRAHKEDILGQEIWVYKGGTVTCTFWRFMFKIPLTYVQMRVRYRINQGPEYEFFVPGRNQNMRWAAYSCNGFSVGVNQEEFQGPGFYRGCDPVWRDLLSKHSQTPYHALVGGGDQLYCDGLTREPELQDWISMPSSIQKQVYPLSDEISLALDRFYFNHYCHVFRTGDFARANSSIPMVNMLDDHDIIDGFGSYPADLQTSPIFSAIGSRGYFFFLLFQCFIVPAIDGVDPNPDMHIFQSTITGCKGPYICFPSHSILTYLGPKVWMLMLDCRAERTKDQVCSPIQYQRVMDTLNKLPEGTEHLIVQLGIPIAYPRMNFLESALESKFNPLTALGRTGSLGLSSMVNKFNADAELLDDLNDHWTSKRHKKERNVFVERLQQFAKVKRIRVTFLSGDVHCAAVGVFKTLAKGKELGMMPAHDHRYMLNVITSAIVNTPPPVGVLTMVSILADKRHRTMNYANTDETMVPLFEKDPSGNSLKSKHIMGRRNWCSVTWDEATGDLVFDIRVEREKGVGETVGYPIRAPPPRWD